MLNPRVPIDTVEKRIYQQGVSFLIVERRPIEICAEIDLQLARGRTDPGESLTPRCPVPLPSVNEAHATEVIHPTEQDDPAPRFIVRQGVAASSWRAHFRIPPSPVHSIPLPGLLPSLPPEQDEAPATGVIDHLVVPASEEGLLRPLLGDCRRQGDRDREDRNAEPSGPGARSVAHGISDRQPMCRGPNSGVRGSHPAERYGMVATLHVIGDDDRWFFRVTEEGGGGQPLPPGRQTERGSIAWPAV